MCIRDSINSTNNTNNNVIYTIFVNKNSNELTYSGIGIINPKTFQTNKVTKLKLWSDVLLPFVNKREISGEVYNGQAVNINSKKDLDSLDVSISEG